MVVVVGVFGCWSLWAWLCVCERVCLSTSGRCVRFDRLCLFMYVCVSLMFVYVYLLVYICTYMCLLHFFYFLFLLICVFNCCFIIIICFCFISCLCCLCFFLFICVFNVFSCVFASVPVHLSVSSMHVQDYMGITYMCAYVPRI